MSDIVLATLNARYAHAAFGLRWLKANLGDLAAGADILEFDLQANPLDVVESILSRQPRIVALGVYIWNVAPLTGVVRDLKRLRPDLPIVLGGPEVSHETDRQEIVALADHVICGEAELEFPRLCRSLLAGGSALPKVVTAEPADLALLIPPYDLYTSEDLAHRVTYVEASRGCPFGCEFCLSSLDRHVRRFPLAPFLDQMQMLLDRGATRFKFVDRTFNLDVASSCAILEFFLQRLRPGLLLHFEAIPDRLPEPLALLLAKFPPGAVQLEIGIQSFSNDVNQRIGRRQDNDLAERNIRWLRQNTAVHIHADLVAGLPGEDLSTFAAGFDRLHALGPQEIQLGILKRLRGAPIARHDADFGMIYSAAPPYEILQTSSMDFPTLQRMRRTARWWDLLINSGNFIATAPLLWGSGSPFWTIWDMGQWLYEQTGRTHSIALHNLGALVLRCWVEHLHRDPRQLAPALWTDYHRLGRKDVPDYLRPHVDTASAHKPTAPIAAPTRQHRHAR